MNPLVFMRLQADFTTLMFETQTVMNLRLMGMSGMIQTPAGENARMIEEKPTAWIDAWAAGTQAMLDGEFAVEAMTAGMAPLSSKVRANRKRLMEDTPPIS